MRTLIFIPSGCFYRSKKRKSDHSSSCLFLFFNLPSFFVLKVVRNKLHNMHETVQAWLTEPCNVIYDYGIWFKALNFFILVMALSIWIRTEIVSLSLTSTSVKWALPPRNKGIFNLTFEGATVDSRKLELSRDQKNSSSYRKFEFSRNGHKTMKIAGLLSLVIFFVTCFFFFFW